MQFDADWLKSLRRRVLAWFAKHARDLPWRRRGDAYAVWVSEIMLQQTQVATVRDYFGRFLEAFPNVQALAQADEQKVLRLWEGLGYYRRARQLHQAARQIVQEHGGKFPREFEAVRKLPGIGRYTAGAILSIAFDARLPILEANTVRLYSRLLAYDGDPVSREGQSRLWSFAEAILPARSGAGDLNQALMDLGATICTPKAPDCPRCPCAVLCGAHRTGRQLEIPRPKAKTRFEDRHEAAIVIRRGGRVLLVQCPDGARWAGLWDFVRFPVDDPAKLAETVRSLTGVSVRMDRRLATFKHGVTRFRITLDCYEAECLGMGKNAGGPAMRWLKPEELDDFPLCTTGRKIAKLVMTNDEARM